MCGIVGYVGFREATGLLVPALRRLEYRGYDSAGIAVLNGAGLEVLKSAGRIGAVETLLNDSARRAHLGIGHTRWATHGRPSVTNAHPHVDCGSRVAIVHNGIIENYRELRLDLAREGHQFRSQTDSEVIAHLIETGLGAGLPEAVARAAGRLRGAYAVACIAEDAPGTLVALRRGGSPLIIGLGTGEMFLASDVPALLGQSHEVLSLDDGEMAVLTAGAAHLRRIDGEVVSRPPTVVPWTLETAEKGGFPHFMLKEIHEQPEGVKNTLSGRVDSRAGVVCLPELGLTDTEMRGLIRLCFVGCGTSWHAALVGKYLVEAFARLPVDVDVASEFRYRQPVLDGRVLTVPISQSGETADTLAALREARRLGSRVVAICNVVGSSMTREADGVIHTRVGIEVGVASTKAFTAQLAAVTLLALRLGLARGTLDRTRAVAIAEQLCQVPERMADILRRSASIRDLAGRLADRRGLLFLGRGVLHPLALEGALKVKEVSYIHAEGYAAGEMKHGPLALVDESLPVIALTPQGPTLEKMANNIEEVRARNGLVLPLVTEGDHELGGGGDSGLSIPPASPWVQPLLVAVPLQLLAYHLGVVRGCEVDRPRNLAKSVTVE